MLWHGTVLHPLWKPITTLASALLSYSPFATREVSVRVSSRLLNWLKSVFQDRIERREQVLHLRRTIERAKDEIYDASDLDFTNNPIGRMVPRDEVRKARLQWLHQQVMQILLGRASRLNFDETQEIKQAFNMLELHPNWIPNDSGYDGIFNQLESAEWLGLTPRH